MSWSVYKFHQPENAIGERKACVSRGAGRRRGRDRENKCGEDPVLIMEAEARFRRKSCSILKTFPDFYPPPRLAILRRLPLALPLLFPVVWPESRHSQTAGTTLDTLQLVCFSDFPESFRKLAAAPRRDRVSQGKLAIF